MTRSIRKGRTRSGGAGRPVTQIRTATLPTPAQVSTGVVTRAQPTSRLRLRMLVTANRDSLARLAGRRRLWSATTGRRVRPASAWPGRALRTWDLPRRQTRREATSAHPARRICGATAASRLSRPPPLRRPGGRRNGPGRYFARRQPGPSAVPHIRARRVMPLPPQLSAAPIARALPTVPESLTGQFIRSKRPLRSG